MTDIAMLNLYILKHIHVHIKHEGIGSLEKRFQSRKKMYDK